jgi:hypothetical protein
MAGNPRHNTARAGKRAHVSSAAPWFTANVRRQRMRNRMARDSRRKNRK